MPVIQDRTYANARAPLTKATLTQRGFCRAAAIVGSSRQLLMVIYARASGHGKAEDLLAQGQLRWELKGERGE